MVHPEGRTTGIVVMQPDLLVLRPVHVGLRRKGLLGYVGLLVSAAIAIAFVFAHLFRAHVSYRWTLFVAIIVALLYAYRITTQVTFVALRSAQGVVIEIENRVLRTKRRRLLHAYVDIRAVRLRSRINPNAAIAGSSPMGAYVHYDVVLDKHGGSHLLWYTRYPECAAQIAKTVASFAGVEMIDSENIAGAASERPLCPERGGA